MRKPFIHMNRPFQSAYQHYTDDPSPRVWENIAGQLDTFPANLSTVPFILKLVITSVVFTSALVLYDFVPRLYHREAEKYQVNFIVPATENKIRRAITDIKSVKNIRVYENINNDISTRTYFYSFPTIQTKPFVHKQIQPIDIIPARYIPIYEPDLTVKPITLFHPGWTLSAISSYGHSAYRLDSDLPSNYQQMKLIQQRERSDLSYSYGLYLTYSFHRKFGLRSGLYYSNTHIQIDPQKIYAFTDPEGGNAFQIVTSSGYAYIKPSFAVTPNIGDSLNTTEVSHRFRTISVPLILKYNTGNGRLSFYPGAGIAANFILYGGLETEVKDAFNEENIRVNKLKGTKNFFWSIHADAEIQYKINAKLTASVYPSVNFAVSPITDNNIVETFPYTISAGIGLNYKF
jgi:hypothetical protein